MCVKFPIITCNMDARRASKQELLSRRDRYMTLEAYQGRVNDKAFGSPELSILLKDDL